MGTSAAEPTPIAATRTEETFEDIEARGAAAATGPKLDEIKLEGDDIPELIRGKSVKEALGAVSTLLDSFKGSEKGRRDLEDQLGALRRQVADAPRRDEPKADTGPTGFTKDQIDAAFKDGKHSEGTAMVVANAMSLIQRNVDERIAPLKGAGSGIVEQQARTKYADDFKEFESDIMETVKVTHPDALSNMQTWDNIITFARGKNVAKFVAREVAKALKGGAGEPSLEALRNGERDSAGASLSATRSGSSAAGASGKLSAEEQRVARSLNMTDDQYLKYR